MPGAGHAVKRWAFVVGATVSPGGDRALVLLGEDREVDGYWGQESWCNRDADGWWINEWCRYGGAPLVGKPLLIDPHRELGPVALALRAPAGATSAIVRYDGREHRVSVSDRGWVFFAAWDHPYPESAGPDWWWAIKAPPALVSFG
jgi:hypothetical protein